MSTTKKTHRLKWHAANTGYTWFSPPLTKVEAEAAARSVLISDDHRALGIAVEVVPENNQEETHD